jgi:Mg-chelatase subunit ChlD
VHIRKRLNRDYIVIMDMSGSMQGRKWEQAKDATMKIAPFACQADPDGITLYLFNGTFLHLSLGVSSSLSPK